MPNPCLALIPYQRSPRLVFSANSATEISLFNPYFLLSLVPESPGDVLHLSTAPASELQCRATRIREAYIDLASKLHPDSINSVVGVSPRALWVSDADVFTHIAGAYRLLLDLELTAKYHAAASSPIWLDDRGSMHPHSVGQDDVSWLYMCIALSHGSTRVIV